MPDKNAKIILAVNNTKLTKVRDTLLVEDNINSIKCQFIFRTSDWDNTIKTAMFARGHVFSNDNIEPTPMILDKNNECNIPHEVLADNGMFSVGIWGTSEDYRIVSNWMHYRIADGCFAEGGNSMTPTQSVYEQILSTIKSHEHTGYILKDEASVFIEEKVSQTIEEVLGASFDAGQIIERS